MHGITKHSGESKMNNDKEFKYDETARTGMLEITNPRLRICVQHMT